MINRTPTITNTRKAINASMRKKVGPPKNPSDLSDSITASVTAENKDKCTIMNNFSHLTLKSIRVANIYLLLIKQQCSCSQSQSLWEKRKWSRSKKSPGLLERIQLLVRVRVKNTKILKNIKIIEGESRWGKILFSYCTRTTSLGKAPQNPEIIIFCPRRKMFTLLYKTFQTNYY